MKIGFVGCGAIGSCYASYLSREHEVCVLDTYAPVIESIKKNGILVDECVPGTGTGETVVFHPAMATTDPKEIGVVDLLIVFVHYQYLEAAVRNALPMIDKHTMILCLQNGLGNYDEIAKVVPEEQIIIGNTAFGSTPVAPGHVKHTGTGVTNMGSLKAPMARVEEMANALREAGDRRHQRHERPARDQERLCRRQPVRPRGGPHAGRRGHRRGERLRLHARP